MGAKTIGLALALAAGLAVGSWTVYQQKAGPEPSASPALREPQPTATLIKTYQVAFVLGTPVFTAEAFPTLDALAIEVARAPGPVELQVHTDSIGPVEMLQRLSEKQALAIKRYLIHHAGVSEQIRVVGHGASRPIAPNTSEQGRTANRRVELWQLPVGG